MQLTPPQPPQDHEFEALRSGLNGFNEAVTGPPPSRADCQLYQG